MKIGKPHTRGSQTVDVRRLNFTSRGTEIRESKVISQQQHNVRGTRIRNISRAMIGQSTDTPRTPSTVLRQVLLPSRMTSTFSVFLLSDGSDFDRAKL